MINHIKILHFLLKGKRLIVNPKRSIGKAHFDYMIKLRNAQLEQLYKDNHTNDD